MNLDYALLDIGAEPQGFVDDRAIADSIGLTRRVRQLERVSDQPQLVSAEPWEGEQVVPIAVVHDDDRGVWRMWYSTYAMNVERRPDIGTHWAMHLAVSDDGLNWRRDDVNVLKADGLPSNNLCVDEQGEPIEGPVTVFDEPHDPDPTKRYKLINYRPNYYLSYSEDGVHWRRAQEDPVWSNGAGDGLEETHFFMRDPKLGKYRAYMRVWMRHQTMRTISLGESDDLLSWSGPKIIWTAHDYYGVGSQIYGMTVFYDGGLYWGLPWMFYGDEPLDPNLRQNMRYKLAWSEDGVAWHALKPEMDVLPMGDPKQFDAYMVFSPGQVVQLADKNVVYYSGTNNRHDGSTDGICGVGIATVRRGGFVSLEAGADEAHMITHRTLIRGDHLTINARTESDGYIDVELLDDRGQYLKGLRFDVADRFTGDDTQHKLAWNGQHDLTSLRGQNVMLRFKMRNAELFTYGVGGDAATINAPLGPRPISAGRCPKTPVIDGQLNDDCWLDFDHCGVADQFKQYEQNVNAEVQTRVLMTYDDTHLYMAVHCDEPQIEKLSGDVIDGELSERTLDNDMIEIRLSGPDQGTFFNQLMVTPAGQLSHCWFSVDEGGSKILDKIEWEAKTSKVPGHWIAEIGVPFKVLGVEPVKPGDTWQTNIIRHRHVDGDETTSWSCLFGSVHRNELSGALVFK
ncbi:MAG: hypothetical protein CMJ49_10650 [Planctomycetaceae bacterium]|nr:hypothetical protein [Planctomycetaceae bacterium]